MSKDGKIGKWKLKFNSKQLCMYPGCTNKSIGSHSLSEFWLEKISNNNKEVIHIPQPLIDEEIFCKIGIGDASVFYGFCSSHDCSLFSPIEQNGTLLNSNYLTREQIILLGLRACGNALYKKRLYLNSDAFKLIDNESNDKLEKYWFDLYFNALNDPHYYLEWAFKKFDESEGIYCSNLDKESGNTYSKIPFEDADNLLLLARVSTINKNRLAYSTSNASLISRFLTDNFYLSEDKYNNMPPSTMEKVKELFFNNRKMITVDCGTVKTLSTSNTLYYSKD